MSTPGRGRGEASKLTTLSEQQAGSSKSHRGSKRAGHSVPVLDTEDGSSSTGSTSSSGEKTIRGRGGFRSRELHTIPAGIQSVRAGKNAEGQPAELIANFVKLSPMTKREVFQYRVDFEPNIESVTLRRRLFNKATESILAKGSVYDGVSDVRSSVKLPNDKTIVRANHPTEPNTVYTITIKRVGEVQWGSFEMLRVYNMNMKHFLRLLGFFQVTQTGSWVHPELVTPVGNTDTLMSVRGYRTAANVHEENQILMNLESVHKLLQKRNVLQLMSEIRGRSGGANIQEACKAALVGKLVITNYNKIVYRIEDINFKLNPSHTFLDRKTNTQVSYSNYFKSRYDVRIAEQSQPLLLVVQNNRRKLETATDREQTDIYVVPELCNLAGLTDSQRNDNRLKVDLIKSSQIPPAERVSHINKFLSLLHNNKEVSDALNKWGYTYEKHPLSVRGRIIPLQGIAVGRFSKEPFQKWPKADNMGNFEKDIMREHLCVAPAFPKMAILVSRADANNQAPILNKLRQGFNKIGLAPERVHTINLERDHTNAFVQELGKIPSDVTACIVIIPSQNKEKYDAVKKFASVERGLITQVITSRLMMDDRKSGGASVKIGIQIAAKIGGEPWYMHLPLAASMVCGYDTYHDTAHRGRSFGAFIASMNAKFSQWFSKADSHEHLDELSAHMAENLSLAIKRYRQVNKKLPERIFIYRDGVSDGQLEHVYNVELKQIKKTISQFDEDIGLTFIVVNKRIGARFYWKNNNSYINPVPGTVVDDVVTRKERYDFYLISQSTRFGTVSPTYYNIIHDESALDANKHQSMAFKFCHMYYNWSGTVRVPAPCQYAHKLALLCGEHLHAVPNTSLDDKLHFL